MKKLVLILSAGLALAACAPSTATGPSSASVQDVSSHPSSKALTVSDISAGDLKTAVFAGGCFWCIESDFEKLNGVTDVVSGYTGGRTADPTYKSVSYTETGHFEAVKVTYDPELVNYEQLLEYYWRHIDPTDPNGQFCDKGSSYRTAIFADETHIDPARQSKNDTAISKPFDGPVVTEILPLGKFHLAEEYHQDYYKKNPNHYRRYRTGCRRDARLEQLWGKSPAYGSDKPAKASKSYGSGK